MFQCDLVLDAAHRKTAESSPGPKREDIIESILFKSSDFVMVHFKDMDSSYARRGALLCMICKTSITSSESRCLWARIRIQESTEPMSIRYQAALGSWVDCVLSTVV